jgi:hypothetical protein
MTTAFSDACIHTFQVLWNSVKSFCNDRKLFVGRDTVDLFSTGRSGNVTLNSLWQVKYERNAKQCSTMNTRCTCEKDILALRLFKDSCWTGASTLHRDVTCVGCCSHSDTVCLLIRSNHIELQPLVNILIWVA